MSNKSLGDIEYELLALNNRCENLPVSNTAHISEAQNQQYNDGAVSELEILRADINKNMLHREYLCIKNPFLVR